jgi:plastocyanin
MSHRSITALAAGAVLVLAACSSSGASSGASTAASGGPSAAGPQVCKETSEPGVVPVTVVDFGFQPADITAKVGQAIAFTNTGATAHTATLDGGGCTTQPIVAGKSDGLVFSATGSYRFHCAIHSSMTGSIVIS